MQIGDELWCHETRSHTRPWFKEAITAETRQSWILGKHASYKVNKKTMLENMGSYGDRRWHTEDSRRSVIWLDKNRWQIAKAVEACRAETTLRQIAALIGHSTDDDGHH